METKKQAGKGDSDFDFFPISYEPVKAGIYHIYMFGAIESPMQFIGALEVLRSASEIDTVVIHLQSCGGSLDATDTLLEAIDECQATVSIRASGGCHSAASLILLRGDDFSLSDNFSSLLHCGSTGTGGKFSDYKSETIFNVKYFEKVMRKAYEGFLTSEEIEGLLKGVDMWLDSDEWCARHEKREAYFQNKVGEMILKRDALLAAMEIAAAAASVVVPVDVPVKKPRKKAAQKQL